MSFTRRTALRLLGGTFGASLMPLNFSCSLSARVVNSSFVPTPDRPLTPTDQFYINANFGVPAIPAAPAWRLYLEGLLEAPRSISYDQLLALPRIRREVTLECIGNSPGGGLISSGAFEGVRLIDVLHDVDPRARGLLFTGLDGYPAYLPIDVLSDPHAMLAFNLNDAPLDADHGAPARAFFPGKYGLLSVKWLDSITATRHYHTYGALRGLGKFVDGTTPVRSRIDSLRDDQVVMLGEPIALTGLAISSGSGVAKVEVRVDDAWKPAEILFNPIGDPRGGLLWTLWRFQFTPAIAGEHLISVRAVDGGGSTQEERSEFPYDSGAIHSVRMLVRG